MRHTRIAFCGVLAAIVLTPRATSAAEAAGVWSTEGARAQVRLAPCGGALCGTIVGLKEPIDPATGRAKTDKHNPDPAKRTRPLIGAPIISAMTSDGANRWKGQLYNAEDGKTYAGRLVLQSETRMKLEGCALGGLVCKAQYWSRAR